MVRIFLRHRLRVLAQGDRVVVGLGHLLAVQPRHARRLGEQGIAARPGSSCRRLRDSRTGARGRPATGSAPRRAAPCACSSASSSPSSWIARAQFLVELGALAAQLLHRLLRLVLEARLAAVEVIEAARDLARELDVRHLILAHRHLVGAVDQDVGRLQQRIAEETVGGQILVGRAFPAGPCRSARAPASPAASSSTAADAVRRARAPATG